MEAICYSIFPNLLSIEVNLASVKAILKFMDCIRLPMEAIQWFWLDGAEVSG